MSLLEDMDKSRQASRKALQTVDPQKVIYQESGWRVQDIVAHITAWEEEAVRSLQAHHQGSAYRITNFTDDDSYNHDQYLKRKDLSTEAVFAAWEKVREDFKAVVSLLETAAGTMLLPWGEWNTVPHLVREMFKHEENHINDIVGKRG
jgi:hypothetical protein